MRIRKSGCVELDGTHCCIEIFNTALSLYRVLRITLYFSEGFSEAVVEVSWPLRVTMVCFLGQKSSLWSFVLQQRYKLFLRCFLYLLLVNLLLLASLEERSTCGELGCFLGVGDGNDLEKDILMRLLKMGLPCSGRLWQDQRQNFSLASRSKTQELLLLLAQHSNVHSYIPSSSNQQSSPKHICLEIR